MQRYVDGIYFWRFWILGNAANSFIVDLDGSFLWNFLESFLRIVFLRSHHRGKKAGKNFILPVCTIVFNCLTLCETLADTVTQLIAYICMLLFLWKLIAQMYKPMQIKAIYAWFLLSNDAFPTPQMAAQYTSEQWFSCYSAASRGREGGGVAPYV